jgi:hypothetical protein
VYVRKSEEINRDHISMEENLPQNDAVTTAIELINVKRLITYEYALCYIDMHSPCVSHHKRMSHRGTCINEIHVSNQVRCTIVYNRSLL